MAQMAKAAAGQITGSIAAPECVADVEASMAAVPEATWRAILNCLIRFNRRDDLGARLETAGNTPAVVPPLDPFVERGVADGEFPL